MNIDDKIKLLPYDIRVLIYNKFWQLEIDKILNSQESQNLNYKPLYNFFIKNNIINNKLIIDNFREHDEHFDIVYKDHYINNKNMYIHFNKLNSLCLSWLVYKYH